MVIDLGFGYWVKPDPYKSEAERIAHEQELEIEHRKLCDRFGLDYDEVVGKKVRHEPIDQCV